MKLDPNPKIYMPNDESRENFDGTHTLYTKYVIREQPDDYTVVQHECLPYDDIANDEFNQILNESNDNGHHGLPTQSGSLKLQHEQFPRILFLGTSSADSYLLRNSTGILVHLS